MPKRLKSVCRSKLCNATHRNPNGYCENHQGQKTNWQKWQDKNGNRHARGYGSEWDKLRNAALIRDKNLCQPCYRSGRLSEASAVDHIKPKAKGGTDDMSNLQSICKSCHDRKTAKD